MWDQTSRHDKTGWNSQEKPAGVTCMCGWECEAHLLKETCLQRDFVIGTIK